MNKEDAYELMLEGKKITHKFFTSNEFLYIEDGTIKDELGYDFMIRWELRDDKIWQKDWSEYKSIKSESEIEKLVNQLVNFCTENNIPIILMLDINSILVKGDIDKLSGLMATGIQKNENFAMAVLRAIEMC